MKNYKKIGYNTSSQILIIVGVIGILLFILLTVTISFRDELFSMLFPKPPLRAVSSGPISRSTAVSIQFSRGTITSVNQNTLVIQTSNGSSTFSLSQTQDIQRITSGSIESFNTVTTPAAKTDLRTGQEVMVYGDISIPGSARGVYIIR